MTPGIATIVCLIGIVGLFRLDRDPAVKTSRWLWLPVVWLWIAGSRTVGQWLEILGIGSFSSSMDSADKYLEGSPLDRNVCLLLTILGVWVLFQRRSRIVRLLQANGPVMLFFFYCAVSTLWSDYTDVAMKRWVKAIGDLVMMLIVLSDPQPITAIKRTLSRVGFVLLPLSVLFIKYYPAWGREYSHFDGRGSNIGVTTNKNLLGMICLILGIGPLWRLREWVGNIPGTRTRGQLIAQGTLLAMTFWLFSKADSATSFSCFVMVAVLMALTCFGRFGQNQTMVNLLVVAIICGALLGVFGGMFLSVVGRDASLTGRTDIWKLVLSLKGNSFVGTGFESFWLGWRRERLWTTYRFHLNEAHNGYIETFVNLGWVGIALLGLLLVTGYRNSMREWRRDSDAGILKLGYLVAAIVYNLTEAGFRMLDPVWIFFLLAIMVWPTAPAKLGPQPQLASEVPEDAMADTLEHNFGYVSTRALRKEAF